MIHAVYFFVLLHQTLPFDILSFLLRQIKISMEYPLRPLFFALSLCTISRENHKESDESECYNELCALEAEVSS